MNGTTMPLIVGASKGMMVGMVVVLIGGVARAQNTMSQAKTACPRDSGSTNAFSDIDGDCECAENSECVMDGAFEAGCPFSGSNPNNAGGFNSGITYFSPSCSTCRCKAITHRGCPESSMSLTPGPEGNCFCSTQGDTMCYMAANATWPGCDIYPKNNESMPFGASRYNNTGRFRSDCKGCLCQPPRYSVANRLSEDEQHCNADEAKCLVSGSLDVAHICPGNSNWEKCCDRDIHGCARSCCGVLPAYLVVLIAVGCLVGVLTPVMLCYCYSKAHPNKVSQDDGELQLPDGRRVSMADLHGHISSPGSKPARPKSAAARFARSAVAGLMPASDRPSTARRREEGAASLPPVRAGAGPGAGARSPMQPPQSRPVSGARRLSGGPPPRPMSGARRLSGGPPPRPLSGGARPGARPLGSGGRPVNPPPVRGGPMRLSSVGGGVMPNKPVLPPGSYGQQQQQQQSRRGSALSENSDMPLPFPAPARGGANSRPNSAAASMRSGASSSSRPGSAASNRRWSGLLEPGEGLQDAVPIEHANFGDQHEHHNASVGGGLQSQTPQISDESSSSSSESDDDGPPTLNPRSSSEMVSPPRKGSSSGLFSGLTSPGVGLQNNG